MGSLKDSLQSSNFLLLCCSLLISVSGKTYKPAIYDDPNGSLFISILLHNSEFRILNSEFRIPKFALRISEFGIRNCEVCIIWANGNS